MSCCMYASHSYARSASTKRLPMSRAMAASTRFHGSVCPPGTHGMLPSRVCTDAIASMVRATSASARMPGTCGSKLRSVKRTFSPSRSGRRDLLAVQHNALSQHRVERALGHPRPFRVALDEHAQEVVVALDRRGVGVVEAAHALQPPVRRVERVRVVRAAQVEAGPLELLLQVVLAVHAHVAAGRVVI